MGAGRHLVAAEGYLQEAQEGAAMDAAPARSQGDVQQVKGEETVYGNAETGRKRAMDG